MTNLELFELLKLHNLYAKLGDVTKTVNGEWGMRYSGQQYYLKNLVGVCAVRQRNEDCTWRAKDGR